jgi:hypothetical protein
VTQEQRWVLYPGYQAPPEGRVRLRAPTRTDRQYRSLAEWQAAMRQTSGDTLWKENSRYVKVNSKSYATMGSYPAPPTPAAPEPFTGSSGSAAQVAAFSEQEPARALDLQIVDRCLLTQKYPDQPTTYEAGCVFGTAFAPDPQSREYERSTNQEHWVLSPGYAPLNAAQARETTIEPDASTDLATFLSDAAANHFPAGSTYVISSCIYAHYRPGNP